VSYRAADPETVFRECRPCRLDTYLRGAAWVATVVCHAAATTEVSAIPIVSEYPDVFPEELPG